MSRIGKLPILLPVGTEVSFVGRDLSVKGPLGSLSHSISPLVKISLLEDKKLVISPVDDTPKSKAMSGTERSLVSNMVLGVNKHFERKLSLVGVGFKAQAFGSDLHLQIGFSHSVKKSMPVGIKVDCPTPTEIVISGSDNQIVGQISSQVSCIRPTDTYKGKGIRYSYPPEKIILKEAKKK